MSANTIHLLVKENIKTGEKERCYTNFMVNGQHALYDIDLLNIIKLSDKLQSMYPSYHYYIKSVDIEDIAI